MKITNKLGLPEPLVNAVRNDPYCSGQCEISVTRLIQPPRKVALELRHADQITEDVTDRLWALFGSAIHVVLERGETKALTEERYSIERQGWVISGKFDRLVVQDGILQDWKVTSVWNIKEGGKAEWEQQLNLLATILRENGYVINGVEVIAVLRDWNKAQSLRSPEYPPCQVVRLPMQLWNPERCEEYLDERIRLHQAARVKLPECSPEERWQTSDVYAVMKDGRKTAVKLFDNESDAFAYLEVAGAGHTVTVRPGSPIRCQSYCPVSGFCEEWKQLQARETK